MINVRIGPAQSYALIEGSISPPQPTFKNIDEEWEDGHGYARLGRKSKVDQLVLAADFDSAYEQMVALNTYANMKDGVWEIEVAVGVGTKNFPLYKILDVEDITEVYFSPVASGGLVGGLYDLVTRWSVQQITGFW